MLLCCVALVCMLRLLDVSFKEGAAAAAAEEKEEEVHEFVGNGRRDIEALRVRIPSSF